MLPSTTERMFSHPSCSLMEGRWIFLVMYNFTEDGREDKAWWSTAGALRLTRVGHESWLGPETYLTSLICSFFIWIGKKDDSIFLHGLSWEAINKASSTNPGIEWVIGQWEFKLVVFRFYLKIIRLYKCVSQNSSRENKYFLKGGRIGK